MNAEMVQLPAYWEGYVKGQQDQLRDTLATMVSLFPYDVVVRVFPLLSLDEYLLQKRSL